MKKKAIHQSKQEEKAKALQEFCDVFNRLCPVGTIVRYWPGEKTGPGIESKTRSEAWVIASDAVLVKVEGYAGGINITHVEIPKSPKIEIEKLARTIVAETMRDYPENWRGRRKWAREQLTEIVLQQLNDPVTDPDALEAGCDAESFAREAAGEWMVESWANES